MAISKKVLAKIQQLLSELPTGKQTYVTSFIQNSPEVPLDKVLFHLRAVKDALEHERKLSITKEEQILKLRAETAMLGELMGAHPSEEELFKIKQRWSDVSPQLANELEVVLTIQLVPQQEGRRVHAVLRKREQEKREWGGGMMPLGYMHPLDLLSMLQPRGLSQEKVQLELANFHAETVDGALFLMANEGKPKKEKTDE